MLGAVTENLSIKPVDVVGFETVAISTHKSIFEPIICASLDRLTDFLIM